MFDPPAPIARIMVKPLTRPVEVHSVGVENNVSRRPMFPCRCRDSPAAVKSPVRTSGSGHRQ